MGPNATTSVVTVPGGKLPGGIKDNLIIVASPSARDEPNSPLLRLIRDYAEVLKRFTLHTTEGTSRMIYGTGLYSEDEVVARRPGRSGGIAQLAAMVARGECSAVILLLDPSDPWSDAVETVHFGGSAFNGEYA